MKKLYVFIYLFIGFTILSCSSDNNGNQPVENQNGFNYDGDFYPTQYAFVNDENTSDNTSSDISITLSSVNPVQTPESTGVNFLYLDYEAVNIEKGTITNLPDYQILYNASFKDSEITGGNTILDDTEDEFMTTASLVTINSITDTSIDVDFSFTRVDGKIITGNYTGSYIDLSD